jgi:hypothetical protein
VNSQGCGGRGKALVGQSPSNSHLIAAEGRGAKILSFMALSFLGGPCFSPSLKLPLFSVHNRSDDVENDFVYSLKAVREETKYHPGRNRRRAKIGIPRSLEQPDGGYDRKDQSAAPVPPFTVIVRFARHSGSSTAKLSANNKPISAPATP